MLGDGACGLESLFRARQWGAILSLSLLALGACGGPPPTRTAADAQASRAKRLVPPWTSGGASTVAIETPTSPAPFTPAPDAAGQHIVETANRMVDQGEVVRGSCYRYADHVFDEAGCQGWRRRTNVFRGSRNGPYADLDLIRPGDWLWIVNHPESDPVGTHSVIFLQWDDRAAGYARVVSYVGGDSERPGDIVDYDVSRTYAIQRAHDPDPEEAHHAHRAHRSRHHARARQ